jgi:SAM-dependent methyltransferase
MRNITDWRRQINRVLRPYIDLKSLAISVLETPRFLSQFVKYRAVSQEAVPLGEIYPALQDRRAGAGNYDPHYFQQDLWVARRIMAARPALHVDVGSRVDGFVAQLSLVVPVEFVDLRAWGLEIQNLRYRQGDLYSLPYPDGSLASLSSLHVVEHVGLGRYGDRLDPDGPVRALLELQRVLAPGGTLYLSVPVGQPRVCFNSHRVFAPEFVVARLSELTLVHFAGIDDAGVFREEVSPAALAGSDYALGIYEFQRPRAA